MPTGVADQVADVADTLGPSEHADIALAHLIVLGDPRAPGLLARDLRDRPIALAAAASENSFAADLGCRATRNSSMPRASDCAPRKLPGPRRGNCWRCCASGAGRRRRDPELLGVGDGVRRGSGHATALGGTTREAGGGAQDRRGDAAVDRRASI